MVAKAGRSKPDFAVLGVFHGWDYSQYGVYSDFPSPYLNKIFMSVASEAIQSADNGAFFEPIILSCLLVVLEREWFQFHHTQAVQPHGHCQGSEGNVTITWESLGSLFQTNTYSVQRKINLNDATWTTVQSGVVSGGVFTSFTDATSGGNTHAFYRITWP